MLSSLGDSIGPSVVGGMVAGWFYISFSWRETAALNAIPALLILPIIYLTVFSKKTVNCKNSHLSCHFSVFVKTFVDYQNIFETKKRKSDLGLSKIL